jgi:hypothetical protein
MLTTQEIVQLGTDILTGIKSLQATVDNAYKQLNAHNAEKGAPQVNPGPVIQCRGAVATIVEQAGLHVALNSPKKSDPATPAQ